MSAQSFDEAQHPRGEGGRFTAKPAGESVTDLSRDPDEQAGQSLAAARAQMDAVRVAYEHQVVQHVSREVREVMPDAAGADLGVYDEDGTLYVDRIVDSKGDSLWESHEDDDVLSEETTRLLADERLSTWTAPEGSPLASKELRW